MLDDLVTVHAPPPNRVKACDGEMEQHLTEGAIMIAFAMHLLRTVSGLKHVAIHPDGEHGKRFDFQGWLKKQGFEREEPMGTTSYGGVYRSAAGQSLLINPKSGRGDVAADINGASFVAECKGGIINTKHAGQVSRLRQGLCETIGQLMSTEDVDGRREFAVVPRTAATVALANRIAARARRAGIEIALVDARGNVFDVKAGPQAH
jgi:hypothetical protein